MPWNKSLIRGFASFTTGRFCGRGGKAPFSRAAISSIPFRARSASARRPWLASQRGDSGRVVWRGMTRNAGTAPMMNIDCQPKCGTSHTLASAAMVRAMAKRHWMVSEKRPRLSALANSLT